MNPPTIRNFTAAPSEIPPTVYDGILPVISLGIHPIFLKEILLKLSQESPRGLCQFLFNFVKTSPAIFSIASQEGLLKVYSEVYEDILQYSGSGVMMRFRDYHAENLDQIMLPKNSREGPE